MSKRVLLTFAVALAGYALIYLSVQHRRVARGPWRVTFTNQSGTPTLILDQTALKIRDVRVAFSGGPAFTNAADVKEFREARPVPFAVPNGECVFLDPLFLPGTVMLKIYGHEIQLMPRTLTIDGTERKWNSGEKIELR